MAEVNFRATTSTDDQQNEPSIEIVDPKVRSLSVSFKNQVESEEDNHLNSDHPNRPSNALWKQQKLPAWQPILTSDTVLPAFFLLGVALIPIGVGLLISSNYVKEYTHEYTDCNSTDVTGKKCLDIIVNSLDKSVKCFCWHNFTLNDDYNAPVFFYYGLSSFYQNHRRYVRSRDDRQLAGKVDKDLNEDCEPFDKNDTRQIAPCGAIANSFFNDTFKLYMRSGNTEEPIALAQTDIAWPTDKEVKYANPPMDVMPKYANPLFWQKSVFDLDFNHPDNNGYKNEHLIIWMRTAALPSFRKLWARIDHDQNILWRTKLPKGDYSLHITYNYPTTDKDKNWKGGKHIYISNTSWMGGKNSFLGYAYIVVGAICLLLWLTFLIIVKKFGQNPKDIVDIGPKTGYTFSASKNKNSSDGSTQPLKSNP